MKSTASGVKQKSDVRHAIGLTRQSRDQGVVAVAMTKVLYEHVHCRSIVCLSQFRKTLEEAGAVLRNVVVRTYVRMTLLPGPIEDFLEGGLFGRAPYLKTVTYTCRKIEASDRTKNGTSKPFHKRQFLPTWSPRRHCPLDSPRPSAIRHISSPVRYYPDNRERC